MKVLLINPDLSAAPRWARRYKRAWPPLDLLTTAALLRGKGHTASLLDARAGRVALEEIRRAASQADLVVLDSSPLDRWQCPDLNWAGVKRLADWLPKHKLILSGAHGSMKPEFVLRETGAAALVRGEPEMPLLELAEVGGVPNGVPGVSYFQDAGIIHEPAGPGTDLDFIPCPAYDLIEFERYGYELLGSRLAVLETSRGCPFSCSFCMKTMYGRGVRFKSLDRVLNEIRSVASYGARHIYFMDLEFTLDREYTKILCRELAELNTGIRWCCQTRADTVDADLLRTMRKAGCVLIHFGVESGAPLVLASTGKNIRLEQIQAGVQACREAGIETACFFLFGLPGETEADRRTTIRFARELNPTYASFHIAAPYPGTALHQFAGSSEPFPACLRGEHEAALLARSVRKAYFSFYLRPSCLIARLRAGTPADKWKQIKLFVEFVR